MIGSHLGTESIDLGYIYSLGIIGTTCRDLLYH